MSANLVAATAGIFRSTLKSAFACDVQYAAGAGAPAVIRAYVYGVRTEHGWGAFFEGDMQAEVDANQFTIVIGQPNPRRFDRMVVGGRSFTVQDWKPAPAGQPTFFKILIRGDVQ